MSEPEDKGSAYSFQLLQQKVDKVALAYLGLTDEMCDCITIRKLVQKAFADGYRSAYLDHQAARRQAHVMKCYNHPRCKLRHGGSECSCPSEEQKVSTNEKLVQLERALESAIIAAMKAEDGAGLKIILLPTSKRSKGCELGLFGGDAIPTCQQLRERILELIGGPGLQAYIGYRAEEATARNVALLAKVWEAAVRYWDFQRELAK